MSGKQDPTAKNIMMTLVALVIGLAALGYIAAGFATDFRESAESHPISVMLILMGFLLLVFKILVDTAAKMGKETAALKAFEQYLHGAGFMPVEAKAGIRHFRGYGSERQMDLYLHPRRSGSKNSPGTPARVELVTEVGTGTHLCLGTADRTPIDVIGRLPLDEMTPFDPGMRGLHGTARDIAWGRRLIDDARVTSGFRDLVASEDKSDKRAVLVLPNSITYTAHLGSYGQLNTDHMNRLFTFLDDIADRAERIDGPSQPVTPSERELLPRDQFFANVARLRLIVAIAAMLVIMIAGIVFSLAMGQ